MPRQRPAPARRTAGAAALCLAGATVLSGCTSLRSPEPVATTRAIAAPTTSSDRDRPTWQDELSSTPSTTTPPMFTVNAPTTTAPPTVTVTSVPTTTASPTTTTAPRTSTTTKTPTPTKTTPAPAKTSTPAKTTAPAPAPAKTTAAPAPAPVSGPAASGCGNPNPGKVFLTFDDGGPMGPALLSVLDRYGIKARWFPTGEWANGNGAFISRLKAGGQLLGNHTYSHPQMYAALGNAELQRQINLGYKPTNVFRFPYGASDATSRALVRSAGYSICGWNIDTNDWQGNSAATITNIVISQAKPGSVVLMHMKFQADVDALPGIITNLRGRGLI